MTEINIHFYTNKDVIDENIDYYVVSSLKDYLYLMKYFPDRVLMDHDTKIVNATKLDLFTYHKNPQIDNIHQYIDFCDRILYPSNRIRFNVNYYYQDIYSKLPQWSNFVKEIYKYHDDRSAMIDLAIEVTFGKYSEILHEKGIIPYTKPWIGILHYTDLDILSDDILLESLNMCLFLIVFTNDMKNRCDIILKGKCKVIKMDHPTCHNVTKWNRDMFNKKGGIVQVGKWQKDVNAIYNVNINLRKYILNPDIYVTNDNVAKIDKLNDVEYDELLSYNIIFAKIISGAAVNTILECIIRATPIMVNRCSCTEELLGKNYPLFYDMNYDCQNLCDKINDAHLYLLQMKKPPTVNEFILNIYNNLP
jgi:hypothetical protein